MTSNPPTPRTNAALQQILAKLKACNSAAEFKEAEMFCATSLSELCRQLETELVDVMTGAKHCLDTLEGIAFDYVWMSRADMVNRARRALLDAGVWKRAKPDDPAAFFLPGAD